MPDRVRRQLVNGEKHIRRPAFRNAGDGRAGRRPFPQQVQRGSVETLIEYDRTCFRPLATGHLLAITRRQEGHSGMSGASSG